MDLRLTLLLIFLHSQGVTKAEHEDTSASETAGSTDAPTPKTNITSLPNGGSSEEDQDQGCVSVGRHQQSKDAIAAAIQKMGLQLLQNLETTPERPNIIISPFSISLALSHLALGAVNETEELLMHHLHDKNLTCYHESMHSILKLLNSDDVTIATRIFLRKGFQVKQDFIDKSQRLYESEPAVLETLQQLNTWVEKATKGKMTNFLSDIPPNFIVMLINAVHFKGKWKARFDPRLTSRGFFYLDDKHVVDVTMMENAKHPLSLFIDGELEAQVARFPFQNDISLLVVMPLSGQVNVSSLVAKLNISRLYDHLPKERDVQVKVPKFKLEYEQELKDVFTKLGLGDMFSSPNLADMADGPLLVSSVQHKSNIELHEDGAEAAAATTVIISRASSPVFHLNHPFLFALMDDKTQVPIFMGIINNPSPGAPVLHREQSGNKDKVGFQIDKNLESTAGAPPK